MLDNLVLFFQPFAHKQFDLLLLIYLVAIAAEAMSGALAAGRRNMDIFGVAVIAFVTALGGGTIRDMVLGNYPIGWTQHPEYVYLVILSGVATTVRKRSIDTTIDDGEDDAVKTKAIGGRLPSTNAEGPRSRRR